MTGFDGFSKGGLEFLDELGRRDREWFQANRETYESEVAAPAKAFVVDMENELHASVGPGIVGQPKVNGSISPINNDVRFAKDNPPYKDHLLFRFWEGPVKKTAPTLFVRLGADDVGFATGQAFTSVDSWREAVAGDDGADLAAALDTLAAGRDLDVAGQALKRVPAPFDAEHPRADLLRHKWFQARWAEPLPSSVHSAGFVDWCGQRLATCAPVHHWLVSNVA